MYCKRVIVLSTFILAVAGMAPLGAARAAENDEQAVRQANAAFYKALNAMFAGETAPMEKVWSHSADVTYMGPGGEMLIGWEAVAPAWRTQAAMKLGGSIQPERMHLNIGHDTAIVDCFEVGENFVDGKQQDVSLRATNVFRKENGQWKMIGHHTDLLPFLAH
jgi:ketosteroid isomerase-like protein